MNFRYIGLLILMSGAPLFGAQAEAKRSAAEQEELDKGLCFAVQDLNVGKVNEFLENGANPNARVSGCGSGMYRGWPLFVVLKPPVREIRWDYRFGNADYYKEYPDRLPSALTIIEALVKKGADVNITKADGETTPLMRTPVPQIAKKLLDLGADIRIANGFGDTALMMTGVPPEAESVVDGSLLSVLLAALKDKTELNRQNNRGWTPLHWAVDRSTIKDIQLLTNAGADPFITSNEGKTALDYAKTPEIKKLLSDYMETYRKPITEAVHAATPLEKDVSGVVAEYVVGPIQPKKAEPKEAVPARKQEQGKVVSEEEDMPEVD